MLVEANDMVPLNGEVIEGVALVDESAITGESAPVVRWPTRRRKAAASWSCPGAPGWTIAPPKAGCSCPSRRSRAGTLTVAQGTVTATKHPVSELEAELSRFRRELASAKLDNEILRKATVYFAKESR